VTPDSGEQGELLELAGHAAEAAARHDRAEGFLRRAMALHRERGDRPALARATAALGDALIGTWRATAALELLEPAAIELADLADDPGVLAVGGQLARARMMVGGERRAIEAADAVLEAAERLDLLPIVADTLVTKGSALVNLGRPREGIGLLRAGLGLAESLDLHLTAFRARHNLAVTLYEFEPATSLRLGRENLEASRRLGRRDATLVGAAAWMATSGGEWEWALGEATGILETGLDREDRANLLCLVAWIRSWRGEPFADALDEVERLAEGLTDPAMVSGLHEARAVVALAAGELGAARDEALLASRYVPAASDNLRLAVRAALWARDGDAAQAAVDALERAGFHGRVIELAGITFRAGLAALDDRPAEAIVGYRKALAGWREIGLPLDEAFTAIEMATLLDPADPVVRAAAERAREILVPLRARPFLDRLEVAMSRRDDLARRAPSTSAGA
jgi:tetratricopeptide (TPR) repeat protein